MSSPRRAYFAWRFCACLSDHAEHGDSVFAAVWGGDYRLNLDGHLTYRGRAEGRAARGYTQFFRNGIVEAVLAEIVTDDIGATGSATANLRDNSSANYRRERRATQGCGSRLRCRAWPRGGN